MLTSSACQAPHENVVVEANVIRLVLCCMHVESTKAVDSFQLCLVHGGVAIHVLEFCDHL